MLHTAHAAYKKILIRTVDTDVVLAVALACTLKEEIEVWVSFYGKIRGSFSASQQAMRLLGLWALRKRIGTTNV